MPKLVTANLLTTGRVVFYAGKGSWVRSIDEAEEFADSETAETALTTAKLDEQRAIVIDPFVVEKGSEGEPDRAMTLRDRIRAYGPTIDYAPVRTEVA